MPLNIRFCIVQSCLELVRFLNDGRLLFIFFHQFFISVLQLNCPISYISELIISIFQFTDGSLIILFVPSYLLMQLLHFSIWSLVLLLKGSNLFFCWEAWRFRSIFFVIVAYLPDPLNLLWKIDILFLGQFQFPDKFVDFINMLGILIFEVFLHFQSIFLYSLALLLHLENLPLQLINILRNYSFLFL